MSSVSRRSFVEVMVGSLVSLPVLAGGLVVAPTLAYAEDDNDDNDDYDDYEDYDDIDEGEQASAKYTIIDVVRPYEVGFIAIDVSKVVKDDLGKDSFPRLTGKKVHVKVISRYGAHKTAEGDTNNEGVANIDIRQLAENPKNQNVDTLETYACNATVQVTCEGYRPFETSLLRVQGGTGLTVPLHPADTKGVWPYRASFDGWDVLYTKNQFVRSAVLKDDHTLEVVARGIASTKPVTMELLVDGEDKPRQSVQATPKGGEATATFKAHFLQKDDAAALPVGKVCKIIVRDGDVPYAWTLALDLVDAVVDEPASKENTKLTPFNTANTSNPGADIKWPSTAPLVGGGGLKFWTPDLPVGLYVNPFGYAQFTLKSPSWGYQNDNGEVAKSGWGKYPVKSVSDQWNSLLKTAKTMGEKTNALVSKPGGIQQLDLFKNFSLKANFQFVACAQWDKAKKLFQGEASGQILVAANFTITENFFAGPIPVLISFALDASFVAALTAACYSTAKKDNESVVDAIMDFGRWQWDYVNTGFTMTLNLTPSLSVGVGIRGVASVSVKGSITLTLFLGVPMGTQPKGLPSPHLTAGWSAQIALVLHLFLFTENFVLRNWKYSNFYDNWEGKDKGISAQEDEAGAALEAMSASDLMGNMKIITDDMLRSTLDVKLNASGMKAQAEEDEAEPIDWDANMREEVIPLEDGTPMTYVVYDLGESSLMALFDEEEPAEEETPAEEVPAEGAPAEGTVSAEGVAPTEATPAEAAPAEATSANETAPAEVAVSTEAASAAETVSAEPAPAESVSGGPAAVGETTPTEETSSAAVSATSVAATASADVAMVGAVAAEQPADQPDDQTSDPAGAQTATQPEGQPGEQTATQPESQPAAPEPTAESTAEPEAQTEAELEPASDPDPDASWLVSMAEGGLANPGVAALGSKGGVRPSSDVKVFSKVFGDPRAKVVTVATTFKNAGLGINLDIKATLSFRIGAVQLADGKVRTRIVANVIDGTERGLSRVLEFDTKAGAGIDHADLYDYDFDFDVLNFTQQSGKEMFSLDMLAITVVSGQRKQGDGTPLANAATDLVFGCHMFHLMDILGYEISGKKLTNVPTVVRPPEGTASFSIPGTQITGKDPGYVHSIASLQMEREGSRIGEAKWIISFIDRRSKNAADVLGNEKGKVEVRLGIAVCDFFGSGFRAITAESTRQRLGDIEDLSVFEHVLFPKIGNDFTLMLRGNEKAYYYLLGLDLAKVALTSARRCATYDASTRLTYWPGNNAFLLSYPKDAAQLKKPTRERDYSSWTLHKATWGGGATPELQMTPVGPENFNISAFALNRAGTFMFWPQARESDVDRVFDADGNAYEQERDASYHIMACRLWKGVFSDPFIVADLPHDTDVLAVLKTDRGAAIEMLGTEFIKGEGGLYNAANIWYSSVPGVRSVTAVGCEAVSSFVNPGAKATFHVSLRNDGNTFLKGCKLTLCAKKADSDDFDRFESASASVTFSKDTIQESNWNPLVNGKLAGVEPDFALAPGKTSVHAVTVTIPADWHGQKKVLFVASEGVKADGDGLAAQADDDVVEVEFSVEPGDYQVIQSRTAPDDDYGQRYMDTIDIVPAEDEETYWQAPVTSPDKESQGKAQEPLPRTGDGSVSGPLAAGLGLAGAALLAYERRRAANERELRIRGTP